MPLASENVELAGFGYRYKFILRMFAHGWSLDRQRRWEASGGTSLVRRGDCPAIGLLYSARGHASLGSLMEANGASLCGLPSWSLDVGWCSPAEMPMVRKKESCTLTNASRMIEMAPSWTLVRNANEEYDE